MITDSKKKELPFFDLYDKFLKDSVSGKRLEKKQYAEWTVHFYADANVGLEESVAKLVDFMDSLPEGLDYKYEGIGYIVTNNK